MALCPCIVIQGLLFHAICCCTCICSYKFSCYFMFFLTVNYIYFVWYKVTSQQFYLDNGTQENFLIFVLVIGVLFVKTSC